MNRRVQSKSRPDSDDSSEVVRWKYPPPTLCNQHDEVYPNILIGNRILANNKKKLKELGITHIVNCAQGTGGCQVETDATYYRSVGISFHGIKAVDNKDFKLTPFFLGAADFIQSALDNEGKVFVHCWAGCSRSASVVLAYLMIKQGIRLSRAVTMVRQNRSVYPNAGFREQLIQLDQKLTAKDIAAK